jgi:hypothetical protein
MRSPRPFFFVVLVVVVARCCLMRMGLYKWTAADP